MPNFLSRIQNLVWGVPMLVLMLGLGLYLSLRLGFVQLRLLPRALSRFFRSVRGSAGQAVCTALAATVGTGNLVGVAGAICLGGPGAIFWMWVCGLALTHLC